MTSKSFQQAQPPARVTNRPDLTRTGGTGLGKCSLDVDLGDPVTLLDPRVPRTAFCHGFPGSLSLLKAGMEYYSCLYSLRICHVVGAHYSFPEFAASCLIQQRSLASDILCGNVTMLSWPEERHNVICSRERSSFRVGGRAGCRLALGDYLQACGPTML